MAGGKSAPESTGVLILGFAGSSNETLLPVRQFYSRLLPSSRIVSTTAVFDTTARHAQLKQALHQRDGVEQLLVHTMSNHGHHAWMSLLDLDRDIGRRLKALVFDCGPAPSMSAEGRAEAAARTAFSAVLGHGISVPRALQDSIRQAAMQVDWAWQTDEDILKLAAKESAVPTLCLCGQSDSLYPERAAQHFAALLQHGIPKRAVRVECLPGDHCNLLQSDPTGYENAIAQLLRESTLTL